MWVVGVLAKKEYYFSRDDEIKKSFSLWLGQRQCFKLIPEV